MRIPFGQAVFEVGSAPSGAWKSIWQSPPVKPANIPDPFGRPCELARSLPISGYPGLERAGELKVADRDTSSMMRAPCGRPLRR